MARKFTSKLVATVVKDAETLFKAKVITFESQFNNPRKLTSPGGMCSCCGAGPRVSDVHDWWLVFRAGLCDGDGVFYATLCGGPDGSGCLEEIRHENARRERSSRDDAAAIARLLNGDDIDGMDSDMDDFEAMGLLDD